MVQQRHPTVCARIVDALHAQHPSFRLAGVRASGEHLASAGFHAPSWQELAAGVRPEQLRWDEDMEPGLPRHGWQRRATEPVHGLLVEGTIRPRLSPTEQALFRSHGGPLAGVPYMCFPTSRLSRMDSSLFRVLLLERLWLPLSPPRASAGVAVHLTPVATTEQLARRQGCWVVEATLWKVPPLACVGKPVLTSPPTCW